MKALRMTVGACALAGAAALGLVGTANAAPNFVGQSESSAIAALDAAGTPYKIMTTNGSGAACTVTGETVQPDHRELDGTTTNASGDTVSNFVTVEGSVLLNVSCY